MSALWDWVYATRRDLRKQGHGRLADLIGLLPEAVCDDEHARADALAAEGLALAADLDLPWLEVYLRHWQLQSRVFHRMEGESALGACVELVDFAHRAETERCPQAVCAVQDLAGCYGFVDGPGFAPERLAVAEEALARIDPSWGCFACISGEKAGALRSTHGPAAALAFLDAQGARMALAGKRYPAHDMAGERVEALIGVGRFEDALAFLDEGDLHGQQDAHSGVHRRIDRARLFARLGRLDEATRALPELSEVLGSAPFFAGYADALAALIRGGKVENTPEVGATLAGFVDKLRAQGVLRHALELADLAGHLAVGRGERGIASAHLATMRELAGRLRKPLDALDRIGALAAALDRLSSPLTEPGGPVGSGGAGPAH